MLNFVHHLIIQSFSLKLHFLLKQTLVKLMLLYIQNFNQMIKGYNIFLIILYLTLLDLLHPIIII